MKAYVINLDKSPDRYALMSERLRNLGLSFERVPGVDGRTMKSTPIPVTAPSANYPYDLKKGEIGCYLGHRRCWERIASEKDDWGLVLEDDVVFLPQAKRYLENLSWIPEEAQLVSLSYAQNDEALYTDLKIGLSDGNTVFRCRCSPPIGTIGYLMHPEAAKLALELSTEIDQPIDNYLFGNYSPFVKRVSHWRLQKCILHPDDSESTIGSRQKKPFSIQKLNPKRLVMKARMKAERKNLEEIHQRLGTLGANWP